MINDPNSEGSESLSNPRAEHPASADALSNRAVDSGPLPGNASSPDAEGGQWLHPISLLFEFAAGIRNQLIPALVALYSASTGSWAVALIASLFFVGWMVRMVLRYIRLRYRLSGDNLIIDEGLVFRVHKTVPVQRIQNIDLVQNLFHRLFGVAEVRIETASGTEPEAVLRVLSLADVASLRTRIFARKRSYELARASTRSVALELADAPREQFERATDGAEPPRVQLSADPAYAVAASEEEPRETLVKLSLGQLALAGIASNRGSILLFLGLGLILQQTRPTAGSWGIDAEDVTRYLPESLSVVAGVAMALVVLLAMLLLVKVLSIVWYVLKFYDYTLDRAGEDLRVSCGLLTRVSATVRRDRIQLISIHRTLIGRWLKIASIRIETAGGGTEGDDPAMTIGRRWFMPVISENQIPAIMEQLSPGLQWDERTFDWRSLSRRAAWRIRRVLMLLFGLLALLAVGFGAYSIAMVVLLLAALAWWWAGLRAAAMQYASSAGKILYRSGVFTQKCSLAFIDKIQSVTVDQSPFDRRWKMAQLSVDTIASGPAEHRITIPMLDTEFARRERDTICRAASLAR